MGGGGNVGDANFLITGDSSGLTDELQKVRAEFEKTGNAASKITSGFEKSGDAAFKAHQESRRGADEAAKATQNLTQRTIELTEAEKQTLSAAEKLRAERAQKIASGASGGEIFGGRTFLDPAETTATARAIKTLTAEAKLLQSTLGSDVAKKRLAEINLELTHLHDNVGSTFKGLPEEANKSAASLSGVGKAIAAADGLLGKFGLNTRQVSILLGAGLAGGVTFVLRELLKFGDAVAKSALELIQFEHQADLTFGSASQSVKDFASDTSSSLGGSRHELLETANAFGLFANQLELTDANAAQFSVNLAQVSEILLKTRPGFKDIADVQKTVQDALKGTNDAVIKVLGPDGLRKLEAASQEAFGKSADNIGAVQREALIYQLLIQATAGDTEILGTKSKSAFEKISDGVKGLTDIVREGAITSLEKDVEAGNTAIIRLGQGPLTTLFDTITGGHKLLDVLKQVTDAELQRLKVLAPARSETLRIIEAEIALREKNSKALKDEALSANEVLEVQKRVEEQFLRNTSAINSSIDAFRSLDEARVDGARSIKASEENLRRAKEDATLRGIELATKNARAEEDTATRVKRAELNLTDIKKKQAARRAEIDDKVSEAKLKAFRSEREAQERLDDFAVDSERKIFDLKLRVKQAREQEVNDITEALIAVESAQRKGDAEAENSARRALTRAKQAGGDTGALAEAERALAREKEDIAIKQSRLERDLKEQREDNLHDLNRAEREHTREVVELGTEIRHAEEALADARRDQSHAREDALRSLHALEIQNARAIFDANKQLEETQLRVERSIDSATRAILRQAQALGIDVTRLKELVTAQQALQDIANGGLLSPFFPGNAAGGSFTPEGANSTGPVSTKTSTTSITINEAHDPEATAAAVDRRLTRNLN